MVLLGNGNEISWVRSCLGTNQFGYEPVWVRTSLGTKSPDFMIVCHWAIIRELLVFFSLSSVMEWFLLINHWC